MELKNFEENHSLVVDAEGNAYAYDHAKQNWYDSQDEDEFDLHPIDNAGFADFKTTIRIRKKNLTPKFIKLIPKGN